MSSDKQAPLIYSATLNTDMPCLAIGLPESIHRQLLHSTAELVRPILNCDLAEAKSDPETGGEFLLIKRNLEATPELDTYLAEALKIIEGILTKIATLMSEQSIIDKTEDGEFWRILINLDTNWKADVTEPKSAVLKPYGWQQNMSTLQWNREKGTLRIKTKTLEELRQETTRIINTLINS